MKVYGIRYRDELQWGHALMDVETNLAACTKPLLARASMGPRPDGRGDSATYSVT